MQYLIVCPLVFLAGLVDSIAGGGGLISLPGYMIAGVPAHMALGTNKMSSTIGTLVSTARLLKHGYLKGKIAVAAVSAVFAMTGSVLGAQIALRVPDSVIRSMMIVILPIVAYYVLRNKNMGDSERTGTISKRRVCVISLAASFVIGTYDGFYGPGTGTFLLLLLTGVAHMGLKEANGITKAINLTTNLTALAVYLMNGKVIFLLGLTAGLFSIAGNYLGAKCFDKGGAKFVKPLMLVVLVIFFVKTLSEIMAG